MCNFLLLTNPTIYCDMKILMTVIMISRCCKEEIKMLRQPSLVLMVKMRIMYLRIYTTVKFLTFSRALTI